MEVMSQFRIQYIYAWKCHNETLCIDILNKQKCLFFSKTEDKKCKSGNVWGLVLEGGGRYKESVQKGKYGGMHIHVWKTC
jgi:hypothetical protein